MTFRMMTRSIRGAACLAARLVAIPAIVCLTACDTAATLLPGAPSDLTALPLDGAVSAAWSLGSEGGSALHNHAYSLDDGVTWTAFDPPVLAGGAVVGGLANGELHRLRVRGVNTAGPGTPSSGVDAVAALPSFLVAAHAPGHLQVLGLAPTRDGGVFVVGYDYGQATFGSIEPGQWSSESRGFVAKLDADAAWVWKIDLPSPSGFSTSVDAIVPLSDGGAVVVGNFSETLDLGPLGTLQAPGSATFVAELDADGVWLRASVITAVGVVSNVIGRAVAVAPDGDVLVAGRLFGEVAFGAITPAPKPSQDAFVARLAPDGVWRWAAVGGADAPTEALSLTLASDGSVVIGGTTRSAQPIATLPSTGHAGNDDGFVAALSGDGTSWRWVVTVGGTGNDRVSDVAAIDGSIVAVGSYFATATFGGFGSRPPAFASMQTSFLLRLSNDGAGERLTIVGASENSDLVRVVPRPGGGSFVAGALRGDVTIDGVLNGAGGAGPYLASFDADDTFVAASVLVADPAATPFGGSGNPYALTTAVGGVPVVGGQLYGALSDYVASVAQSGTQVDLFVWKTTPAEFK